jgi:hypothetical protein
MVAVRVVQVPADEIIDVVSVGHRLVAAARAVPVSGIMTATVVPRRALLRIRGADGDGVLVHMVAVRVVQVPVMEIIDMLRVLNRGVAATRAVLMIVSHVGLAFHFQSSFWTGAWSTASHHSHPW